MARSESVTTCTAGRIVFARLPDDVWPTAENPCTEPAGPKGVQMVTPGVGHYSIHARLCPMHMAEFMTRFSVSDEPFKPEGRSYWCRAKRVGEWWELTIPDVGVTQCEYLGDAWRMAADYISVLTGEQVTQENIRMVVEGEPEEFLRRPGQE